MCGISGKVYADQERIVSRDLLKSMCDAMQHRGPDDEGFYVNGNVGLCMRRLQVIDLPGGHQPMSNEDGSLWIVFNGEIYNYKKLRNRLEGLGHSFRTSSDTETILHLYEERGVNCVDELHGMFAFAIWDQRTRVLFLARDRLGKKPLYYSMFGGGLVFSSELQSLLRDPDLDLEIDPKAVDEYLTYLFVPHPRTIYRGIFKMPPATSGVFVDGQLSLQRYWQVRYDEVNRKITEDEAVEELDARLGEAVKMRLLADVPVGSFLSGGLDSTLVASLMQRESNATVKTFSIGFKESSFNELEHAREAARFLETDHEEYVVSYDVEELLPGLINHFGEPFADSSAIPAYHIARATRTSATVALSGDGGDEVFGGYRRYKARKWANIYNRIFGAPLGGPIEWVVGQVPEPSIYYGASRLKKTKRFLEFAAAVRARPQTSWGFFLNPREKRWLYSEEFVDTLNKDPAGESFEPYYRQMRHTPNQYMMWLDLMTYLPDDILTKIDRTSMARSLEVRCPLLDHKVVEFMAQVPYNLKIKGANSKVLLRKLAERYVPERILRRPKQGFAIPLSAWIRDQLRPWVEEVLLSSETPYFKSSTVKAMLQDHVDSRRDWSQQLWALVVFELWLKKPR